MCTCGWRKVRDVYMWVEEGEGCVHVRINAQVHIEQKMHGTLGSWEVSHSALSSAGEAPAALHLCQKRSIITKQIEY